MCLNRKHFFFFFFSIFYYEYVLAVQSEAVSVAVHDMMNIVSQRFSRLRLSPRRLWMRPQRATGPCKHSQPSESVCLPGVMHLSGPFVYWPKNVKNICFSPCVCVCVCDFFFLSMWLKIESVRRPGGTHGWGGVTSFVSFCIVLML